MTLGRARVPGRRLAGVGIALLLGIGLTLSPVATRPAAAADSLRTSAATTYTLDPGAGRVHVVIKWEVTDLKPNSAQFVYYYSWFAFSVQPEAKSVRASDGGGALGVTTHNHADYVDVRVDFRKNLYYRDTAKFTVRYDLVGGAPRSSSYVRVGKAFSTWGVWAWGDANQGTVEVNLPGGFAGSTTGDPMSITRTDRGETLHATPASPESFFAVLTADNQLAYTSDRLSLEGGVEVVVQAWPEDRKWEDTVSETLRKAMPELRELIGLDWPVEHDLNVRERYTPALEGYAGVFFSDYERIDVSEDLDPETIVHEASHAWFNEELFADRWIYEGLAQEYAWRVQEAVHGEDRGLPASPDRNDPGHVLLATWTFPEVIRDQRTDDTERYGYEASFFVIHRLVQLVGEERMRAAFAAADGHVTAYPGAGPAETVSTTNGWKRFLDLVETFDRTDSADTERSFRDYVLNGSTAAQLDERADARQAYQELVVAGGGWLPGWYIRKPMGEWRFADAEARITKATAVLDLRRQVDAAAAALGLQPNGALKGAYEGASDSLDPATTLATDELATLSAIDDARARVEAAPDVISQLGLLGSTPRVPYDAARASFEGGDMAGARASAVAAAALITGAAAIGQQRLLLAAVVIVGLLVLIALLLRRRRRRRRLALATAAVGASTVGADEHAVEALGTVPGDPYATLAADPGAPPPMYSDGPPDTEGGIETPP